jgi:two-component system, cell cycle sensor histidine kinase DivJ
MTAILPAMKASLEMRQILPAHSRLRLFRQTRSIAAGLMLLLFPMMAATSLEPLAVIGALALFGILPAAIALDARRPAQLDRAVIMAVFVAAIVLFAGTLRGLNGAAALAIFGVMLIESALLVRPATRTKLLLVAAAGIVALAVSSLTVEPVFGTGNWSLSACLLTITLNMATLSIGLSHIMFEKKAIQNSVVIKGSEIDSVISEAVVCLERTGMILRVSDNAERVLNIPGSALLGRGLVELILVSERPALLTSLAEAAQAQKTSSIRFHMRTSVRDALPSYRWVELTVSPSATTAGQLVGALRDINDLMLEEGQMKTLEAEAEQAKLARAAFLSTINHELRTPLNAIIGFSEILANPGTIPVNAAKTQEYATLIHGAGRDLFRKISAMVDVTRLDSGVYDIAKEPTDISNLIESAIESFRHEPDALDVPIEFRGSTVAIDSEIDSRAIRSVMHQLLSNAAKFGGKLKPIRVSLGSTAQQVTISVTDSGPGIPRDKLELLGNHFARLDETLNRAHGGIGLGLSLTRGIMSLHQGSMSIESKSGKGTTVMLTLPRHSAVPAASDNLIQLGSIRSNSIAFDHKRERRNG